MIVLSIGKLDDFEQLTVLELIVKSPHKHRLHHGWYSRGMSSYDWELKSNKKITKSAEIVDILLKTREIKDKENFLTPPTPDKFVRENKFYIELFKKHIKASSKIIKTAIINNQPIVIHGDYDVDGQSSTAILWRTIHNDLGYKNVIPYIPNRFNEGYGLSKKSIQNILKLLKIKNFDGNNTNPLLITVDCGITAVDEVEHAKKAGFTVIITDHHQKDKKLPKADEIIWTDKATGAGIAWMLSYELLQTSKYLDLAALGTIADLQPLTEFNRSVAKYGLSEMNKNPSVGIQALKKIAGTKEQMEAYEIGWVIGPRLNAPGRLESAMDSLKLLCTDSKKQATELANNLNELNKRRQDKTFADVQSAQAEFDKIEKSNLPPILVTTSETYHEGIIGLIAGKLTQTYNRAAIAISINKKTQMAKGSARSISGISIIDTLRKFDNLLESVGGHDMAAGFSIKVENLDKFRTKLLNLKDNWNSEVFKKKLIIDLELPANLINLSTYNEVAKLKPFGIGNLEPVFATNNLRIFNLQSFGKENKHLKLFLEDENGNQYEAPAFNKGYLKDTLKLGQMVNVAHQLSLNMWNNKMKIELRVRDIDASYE